LPRFRASSRKAHIVVWFEERCAANADRFCLLNDQTQLDLIRHAEHDEVTTLFRLKTSSGLQARVTDLHDLIGDGQIGANQGVAIARRNLLMGHGEHPR